MVRIYQEGTYSVGETIELSKTASQHVYTVLRMNVGDSIILFCGDQHEHTTTITHADKKKVLVAIHATALIERESPCPIHLAQGVSKGERMEWVLQKSVELGVASITPLLSARSVVRLAKERWEKKIAHWQAIAIAACEQSGRNIIPLVHPVSTLSDFLNNCTAEYRGILHPKGQPSWHTSYTHPKDIALLIGPEGGFAEAEIQLANTHKFQPWRLGPRILRTETATVTALSILQATHGDLR